MRKILLFVLSASTVAFAGEPIKVCVAQMSGPEAKNWKMQAPIAQRMEQQAPSKQLNVTAPLLRSDSEKQAKSEAGEKACSYILLTSIEVARDEVFRAFNPDPHGRPEADVGKSMSATPRGFSIKYKVISPDGKKVASATVNTALKENPAPADFQETGNKMIDSVVSEVLTALGSAK